MSDKAQLPAIREGQIIRAGEHTFKIQQGKALAVLGDEHVAVQLDQDGYITRIKRRIRLDYGPHIYAACRPGSENADTKVMPYQPGYMRLVEGMGGQLTCPPAIKDPVSGEYVENPRVVCYDGTSIIRSVTATAVCVVPNPTTGQLVASVQTITQDAEHILRQALLKIPRGWTVIPLTPPYAMICANFKDPAVRTAFSTFQDQSATIRQRACTKAERLAGRLKRKGTRENLAPEYLGAIDDILENYDFRKVSGKAEHRRQRMQAYLAMMEQQGRMSEVSIPKHVQQETRRVPYKQLSVQRLEGVFDSLKNIEHTARMKQKLRLAQEERELQEVRNEIAGAFDENIENKPLNRTPTWVDKKREGIKGYFNLVRNADTILRKIDGWTSRGVMVRYFKEDIDRAGSRAKELRDAATEAMDSLFSRYDRAERDQMTKRRMWDGYDQALSKWDIVSIALNMGNDDNYQRLTSRDSRAAFTKEQVDALVDNLDERDWKFVQAVWDYLDGTYWPLIAERERRMTGVAPKKVEARPVQTKYGEFRGGYYPIVYDSRYSKKAQDDANDDLMQQMMAGRFAKAQTRNGHTKEREGGGGGRTVELGMHVFFGHVDNVIHDLAFGEPVNNAWKLLRDPQVRVLFEDAGMLQDHAALELWLQDVAAGPAAGSHAMAGTLRHLKSGFTLSKLAFNMSTVAIQITGLTQSMATIGNGYMFKGIYHYLTARRGRIALANDIMERSTFMRERQETFHRDTYDLYREVQLNPMGGRVSDFQKGMISAGFWAMQKVQYYAVDVPTWLGAHQRGLDEGMTDSQAVQFADRMVARAQASGLYADRTAVERGTMGTNSRQNEFLRLFTALGSYMFAKYNVAEEVAGRTRQDIMDPSKSNFWAITKGITDMLLLFTVEAILYNLVKGALPGWEGNDDEDEGWAEFLAEETAMSVASVFPFVRDVSSAVQGYGGGGAYGGIAETIGRATGAAGDLVTGEATVGDIRSANDMLGLMAIGYPSTFTWRLLEGAGATGEEPSPVAMIMGR